MPHDHEAYIREEIFRLREPFPWSDAGKFCPSPGPMDALLGWRKMLAAELERQLEHAKEKGPSLAPVVDRLLTPLPL